ncbi:MAG: SUMF1/EgtB/PvdO family nonheme iron enzyme [Planctomycetota bacterium]
MLRGGAWNNNPDNCRAAHRNRNNPGNRNTNIGFRLALHFQALLHRSVVPRIGWLTGWPSVV